MKKLLLLLLLIPNLVMAESFSFNCKFSDGVATNFDKGSPESGDGGNFTDIIYDQINPKEGTGRIIGNAGAEDVMVFQGFHLWNQGWDGPVGQMDPSVAGRTAARARGKGGIILLAIQFFPQFLVFGYGIMLWQIKDVFKPICIILGLLKHPSDS